MSLLLITDTKITNIADAIRTKTGAPSGTTYTLDQMPTVISGIQTGISLSASDEGKVVSNGALVAQTARATDITENGTYDTTLNNEVVVNIPTETKEPFIEAQGTTYFDTGVPGNTAYKIEFEFTPISMANSYQRYAVASTDNFTIASMNTDVTAGYIRCGNTDLGVVQFIKGVKNTIVCDNGVVTINGTQLSGRYTGPLNTTGTTIKLLGVSSSSNSHVRLFRCTLYDVNGNKLRDYVPKEDQDFIACLHDNVSNTDLYGVNNKVTYGFC